MELNNIQQFLEKYRKRLFGEEERLNAVLAAIKDGSSVVLNKKELAVKNGTIYLHAAPAIKNEIFLHKERILLLCKERGLHFTEIR